MDHKDRPAISGSLPGLYLPMRLFAPPRPVRVPPALGCRLMLLALGLGLALPDAALAETVFQDPQAFISEVFADRPPPARTLTLSGTALAEAQNLLGRAPDSRRIRYWGEPAHTAFVLDEIGKEEPITTGISVRDGRIERVQVLIYRESRGNEVQQTFFTDQFKGAALGGDGELTQGIDGISGATLSVQALTRLARFALLLHRVAGRDP